MDGVEDEDDEVDEDDIVVDSSKLGERKRFQFDELVVAIVGDFYGPELIFYYHPQGVIFIGFIRLHLQVF